MLELSPTLFSTFGCPLEEPISEQENYGFRDTETPESFTHFPPSQPEIIELGHSTSFTACSGSGDPNMVKKLNHNASERHRRKKINNLYSSLRSLLPAADQTKKLSIPGTVSRVLKYIPELQQQVERLVRRKEELLSKKSRQDDLIQQENKRRGIISCNSLSVSASRLGDREVVIQISTYRVHKNLLSEILLNLEDDGLVLINSSSFESFGGRVFYNLHLQIMEGTNYVLESEALTEKLVSLHAKRELLFS